MGFLGALKISQGVLSQYKQDCFQWWQKMDGTPILNDLSVRMAEAFIKDDSVVDVHSISDEKLLHIAKSFLQRTQNTEVTKDSEGKLVFSSPDVYLIIAMKTALFHIHKE